MKLLVETEKSPIHPYGGLHFIRVSRFWLFYIRFMKYCLKAVWSVKYDK